MKLKQVIKLLFLTSLVLTLGSCNSSDDYTVTSASADAQVYSFSLKGTPVTSIDTANYPVLARTKFAIDQYQTLIFNQDSLPYQTTLSTFYATVSFSSSSVSQLQLIYPKDSVVDWNSTDSIDFSTPLYPKLKVVAADGTTSRTYTIDIRVHSVDPDLLVWQDLTAQFAQPNTIKKQKTFLVGDEFYTFSHDAAGMFLYKADKSSSYAPTGEAVGVLPASDDVIQNIIAYKGSFFTVDGNQGYSSADGITWSAQNSEIYSLLGILPAKEEADDVLLVVTKNAAGNKCLATTTDLLNLNLLSEIDDDFPKSGFASVTNYNRKENLNLNVLAITGGETFNNELTNRTWLIQIASNGDVRHISNQVHYTFPAKEGIAGFMYDGYLYALVNNQFYKSQSFGSVWTIASDKEISPYIDVASGQSIIVDNDNYVWMFGGTTASNTYLRQVWRGRLNKLYPK